MAHFVEALVAVAEVSNDPVSCAVLFHACSAVCDAISNEFCGVVSVVVLSGDVGTYALEDVGVIPAQNVWGLLAG